MRNGLHTVGCVLALCVLFILPAAGQRPRYDKLSPMLRQLVRNPHASLLPPHTHLHTPPSPLRAPSVCSFVKIADGGEEALLQWGCKVLAQEGDICIVNIPVNSIGPLSLEPSIVRMEARPSLPKGRDEGTMLTNDSMALHLHALPVYEGEGLPQAYTGKGVVVGVMDIGFDLTHPTFYSTDGSDYRIRQLWDMVSADTVGSTFYVGRDYVGRDELLALRHCRDGEDQYHGTHTVGTAAGSGAGTPFRGMAPEADICLVANAVSDDIVYIDSADYYKYTFATDALGFKYLADYARSQGKPCVISFSEGSIQDFWGYDQLYYEMLSRLTGPGCIIVSAAGNYGNDKFYFRKYLGVPGRGTFITPNSNGVVSLTLKSPQPFDLRLVAYSATNDTLMMNTASVVLRDDSLRTDTLHFGGDMLEVVTEAYPSCYNEAEMCYDVTITPQTAGIQWPALSLEVMGEEACVDAYRVAGHWTTNGRNPSLLAGEKSHSILSPASSPGIICVGNNGYSFGRLNTKGEWRGLACPGNGLLSINSSVGPTYDERKKPDVVAPGMNIVSSFNSFYEEHHPDATFCSWDVSRMDYQGRTYSWNLLSGTSMSCPAVAGAIALWMQAKPDLTMEEVLDVFSHTCRQPDASLRYPNNYYGYGEIDVYAGLLYLLGASSIEGVSSRHTRARIICAKGELAIEFGTTIDAPVTLRLYSLSGRLLLTRHLAAGQTSCSVQLPSLGEAVYVVQIDGPAAVSGSTLIRP